MAISYPIEMPEGLISNIVWTSESAQQVSYSPRSFSRNIIDWGGQRFKVDITVQRNTHEKTRKWRSFILSMHGAAGSFLLNPYGFDQSFSYGNWNKSSTRASSRITIVGQDIVDSTLRVQFPTSGIQNALAAGDFVQIGFGQAARLHMVLEDVSSDASSIEIWPRARKSSVGGRLTTLRPKGVFYFSEPIASWTQDPLWHHDITFTAYSS